MASELKVLNQFREVILHIRLTSGDAPELFTIEATDEMRSAVSSLIGQDFDRTVGTGNKLRRFEAIWGSPDYARILAEYFQQNFGWSTSLVETEQPSSLPSGQYKNAMAAAAGFGQNGVGDAWSSPSHNDQLYSGPVFMPVFASNAGQQSGLGELQ